MRRFAAIVAMLMVLITLTGCAATEPGSATPPEAVRKTTAPSQDTAANTKSVTVTVNDLVGRLTAAGINVKHLGQLPMPLFGATSGEGFKLDTDVDASVYVFADTAAASRGLAVASNPQANTISWAFPPRFFQDENLLVVMAAKDAAMGNKVEQALK